MSPMKSRVSFSVFCNSKCMSGNVLLEVLLNVFYYEHSFISSDVCLFCGSYYCVYDSGDRQRLLEAYHDGACFSLSLPPINNPSRYSVSSLSLKHYSSRLALYAVFNMPFIWCITKFNINRFINNISK